MNIFLLMAASLFGAMQLTSLLAYALGKIPYSLDFAQEVLPEYSNLIRPEREMLLLGAFVVIAIVTMTGLMYALRHRINEERLIRQWVPFVMVEAMITFLMMSAIVKQIFYDYNPTLAVRAFIGLMVLAVINKCAWLKLRDGFIAIWALITALENRSFIKQLLAITSVLIVALVVYIPDYQRVIARIYIGEQFHHHDIFVMAAGWAAYTGHIMDVDHISQYGVGMPMVFAGLCRMMGGFTHEHVFLIFMWGNIIYFSVLCVLLNKVLRSPALTLATMLTLLRVQLCHPGVYPFALTYPSATAIRYIFDIFFFGFLWLHLSDRKTSYGWQMLAMGILCALANFYMDSTGIFLTAGYYFYLLVLILHPEWRRDLLKQMRGLGGVIVVWLLPVILTVILFYWSVGQHMFTAIFWENLLETVDYFLSGIGTYPMNENFKYHNFFAGIIGFVIPLVYVFTILIVGALVILGKICRRHVWIVVLCIYGLGINHYYIARSVLTSYYVTAWPLMVVAGYWLKMFLTRINSLWRIRLTAGLLALSIYAIATNHNFIAYPNIFNFSHNAMVDPLVTQPLPADRTTYFNHLYRNDPPELKLPTNSLGQMDEELKTEKDFASDDDLVDYYRKEFDFSRDAAMIKRLTSKTDRVAVISDFEIKILIQSNRAPLFYYFPLINSRPKHMRTMPINFLHTNRERFIKRAISDLASAKSAYVFLERIFMYQDFPKAYADKPDNIIPIIEYVRAHYEPIIQGEYIVALKRKQ